MNKSELMTLFKEKGKASLFQVLKEKDDNDKIEILTELAKQLRDDSSYEDSMDLAFIALDLVDQEDFENAIILLIILLTNYIRQGDLNSAKEIIEKIEKEYAKYENIDNADLEIRAKYLGSLGQYHYFISEFSHAVDIFVQALELSKLTNNTFLIANSGNNLSLAYIEVGRYEEAHNLLMNSFKVYQELDMKSLEAVTLNNIGLTYDMMGNPSFAIQSYQMAYMIYEQVGKERYAVSILINLGKMYLNTGEIQDSLDHYHLGLEKSIQLGLIEPMSHIYLNLTEVFFIMSEMDRAKNSIHHCIMLSRENNLLKNLVPALHYKILLELELGNKEIAEKDYEELGHLLAISQDRVTELYYLLSKTLMLQINPDIKHLEEAYSILKSIINYEEVDFWTKVLIFDQLPGVILQLLKLGYPEEIIDEYYDITNDISKIIQTQKLVIPSIKLSIYNAKFDLIKNDFLGCKTHLEDAYNASDQIGLLKMKILVSDFFDLLLPYYRSWQERLQTNMSILERIESLEVNNLIAFAFERDLLFSEINVEQPQMLLIIDEEELIYHCPFVEGLNPNLIQFELRHYQKNQTNLFAFFDQISLSEQLYHMASSSLGTTTFVYLFKGQSFVGLHNLEVFIDQLLTYSSIIPNDNIRLLVQLEQETEFVSQLVKDVFTNKISPKQDILTKQVEDFISEQTIDVQHTSQLHLLNKYKTLMQPVRLSIMKLLSQYFKIGRAELLKLLNIPSGSLSTHLNTLESEKLITQEISLEEYKPKKVVYVTPFGQKYFEDFQTMIARNII